MNNEQLINKIKALMAKARDKSVTEAEAAMFMQKAQELLEKHNLDMASLADEEPEGVVEETMREMYGDPWRRSIATAAARLYYCEMYNTDWWDEEKQKFRPGFVILGRRHNILVAIHMIRYLLDTTRRLALNYSKLRAEQLGFERGCGMRLASRLRTMHVEAMAKAAAERKVAGNDNLPALYENAAAENKAHMDGLNLHDWGRGTSFNHHSIAGAKAAEGVSLAPQISAGQASATGQALPGAPLLLGGR